MGSGSSKNVFNKKCSEIKYLTCKDKQGSALKTHNGLICHKPNPNNSYIFNIYV